MKLGVVIPTLNCAHLMEAHIDSMLPWMDRVDEIVVVDSNSTDGTVEILTSRISHPNLQVHQRPRGLYQAWNYGIEQIHGKYTYVSTVGDSITPLGIDHLLNVAEMHDADVVVSSPEFINEDGSPSKNPPSFPIEHLLERLDIVKPKLLTSMECFDFLVSNFPNAILGSSASNLYRTDVLKMHPFPTSYGTAGDGAWGIAYGLNHRIAVTPRRCSTFRVHEKAYSKSEYAINDLNDKLLNLFAKEVHKWIVENEKIIPEGKDIMIKEVVNQINNLFLVQRELEFSRSKLLPWILNPKAWNVRSRRSKIRNSIIALTKALQTN